MCVFNCSGDTSGGVWGDVVLDGTCLSTFASAPEGPVSWAVAHMERV